MKLALALTAALFVSFARAQDAQNAAAAATATAEAAPAAAAPKKDAPKKTRAKPKKKAAKGKQKPAPESKYKSRALTENGGSQYRFDENGNPIEKKKPAAKASKKSPEEPEDKPACTEDAPCADKKSSDADAL